MWWHLSSPPGSSNVSLVHSYNDVRQVVLHLLQPILSAAHGLRDDRRDDYAGALLSCLLAILHQMTDDHYTEYVCSHPRGVAWLGKRAGRLNPPLTLSPSLPRYHLTGISVPFRHGPSWLSLSTSSLMSSRGLFTQTLFPRTGW